MAGLFSSLENCNDCVNNSAYAHLDFASNVYSISSTYYLFVFFNAFDLDATTTYHSY